MSNTRPELSTKNKYWISKYKYYELKYFCLQYPEWKKVYECLDDTRLPSSHIFTNGTDVNKPTEDIAIAKSLYLDKIKMVEKAAKETDELLSDYILKAVTQDLSFVYLDTVLNIPCSRGTYYDRYRKFFWILSKKR